jgi:CubicO group peptidase (beta-lactamase class C family)
LWCYLCLLALLSPCLKLRAQATSPDDRCPIGSLWPGGDWPRSNPYTQHVDGAALHRALGAVETTLPGIYSVLVVRNGYIVAERYYHGYGPRDAFEVAAVTQSVTSALVGVALREGKLAGVDVRLASVLPDAAFADSADPARDVTLKHLLTMGAGVAPRIVTVVLARATGASTHRYASDRLFQPIGIREGRWWWPADSSGVASGSFGLRLTARDLARIGYLYLRDGCWEGRAILPSGWVTESTQPQVRDPREPSGGYGYQWWSATLRGHRAFYASGYGGQYLVVVPDLDLVTVITADLNTAPTTVPRHLELVRDIIIPAAR